MEKKESALRDLWNLLPQDWFHIWPISWRVGGLIAGLLALMATRPLQIPRRFKFGLKSMGGLPRTVSLAALGDAGHWTR